MTTTTLPFGRHKGQPLPSVPMDYLRWLAENAKLSSGLRTAVVAELQSRGVQAKEQTPPPPPRCWRCKDRTEVSYSWHEDSLGRRRIKRVCACGSSLGFAPHVPEFIAMADAAAAPTAILDVLTQCEERGIELVSDGKAVRVVSGWERLTPELKAKIGQCRHQLAKLIGNERAEVSRR
jgi:hypothetical protein